MRKNAFAQKLPFQRICAILGKNSRTALHSVITQGPANTMTECNSRHSIEQACIQEGLACYSQTHDTPFMTSPLYDKIGDLGYPTTIQKILNGTYSSPRDLDPYTKAFIHELKQPTNIPPQPTVSGHNATPEYIKS